MTDHSIYHPAVLIITAISCSLSLIGAIAIFTTFFLLPEIRNFARKLVLCLTLADLITAAAYLESVIRYASTESNDDIQNIHCKIQSFFTTYSSLVSFFFTTLIAVYLYDTVVNNTDRLATTCWLVAFNIVCWTIPGCIVLSAWDVLGSDKTNTVGTGPWCWISTSAKNCVIWMVWTGKGWECACYLITTSLYVLLKVFLYRHFRRATLHHIHVSLRNEDTNFLYVWFLLYALRIWGTLRFFLFAAYNNTQTKGLLYLQAFGDPGQAFGNFFLFCVLDETVRTKMKQLISCQNCRSADDSTLQQGHENRTENIYESESLMYGSISSNNSSRQLELASYTCTCYNSDSSCSKCPVVDSSSEH